MDGRILHLHGLRGTFFRHGHQSGPRGTRAQCDVDRSLVAVNRPLESGPPAADSPVADSPAFATSKLMPLDRNMAHGKPSIGILAKTDSTDMDQQEVLSKLLVDGAHASESDGRKLLEVVKAATQERLDGTASTKHVDAEQTKIGESARDRYVAICIVGQSRGFTAARLIRSIARHGVQAAQAEQVHVFVRITVPSLLDSDAFAVHSAATMLNATNVSLVRESEHDLGWLSRHLSLNASCLGQLDALWRRSFAFQVLEQKACYDMVLAHETLAKRRFEYIVKLRADQELCKPLPPVSRWPAHAVSTWTAFGRVHDHLAIVPRSLADLFFSASRELELCLPGGHYAATPPGCHTKVGAQECLLSHWLARSSVRVNNGNCLVRRTFASGPTTILFAVAKPASGRVADTVVRRVAALPRVLMGTPALLKRTPQPAPTLWSAGNLVLHSRSHMGSSNNRMVLTLQKKTEA